jgi:hypothetical protein
VYYRFHPLFQQELEVLRSARREDGALTLRDHSGKSLKIPSWMASPASGGMDVSEQAKLRASALISLLELIETHLSNLGTDLSSVENDPFISGDSTREGGSHEAAFVGRARSAGERRVEGPLERKSSR